jgi:hypothetical protein
LFLFDIANDTYQPLLKSMLPKLRIVAATLMLTEQDVANFNQLLPVYIDKFGTYFFVNKISNWMAGRPCKVELVKI